MKNVMDIRIKDISHLLLFVLFAAGLVSSCSSVQDTIVFSGSLNGYLDACG